MEEKVESVPKKPEIPVVVLSKHRQLINLMKALNYIGSEGGTCSGYAYMGMQAVFANELEVFNQRVNRLLEIPLDDLEKAAEIRLISKESRGRETKETLLKEILEDYLRANNLLIDTLAFFDGVELHQQRKLYPHLFEDTEPLTQDSFVKLTTPQKIKNQGEIASLPQRLSGVYKHNELATDYFALLRKKINSMAPKPAEPICLAISGYGLKHAVAVSYDPQSDKWSLIDANTPPSQEYTEDAAIAQALIKACSKNEIAVIETIVYSFTGNEHLERVLTSWMQEVQKRALVDIRNKIKWKDSNEGTWLMAAISANDHELIKRLAANGANINAPRGDGVTPLIYAILSKNKEAIEALLDCGVELDISHDYADTPLRVAVSEQDVEIIKLLLEKGADPNFLPENSVESAFNDVVKTNNYELVNLMLAYGASYAKDRQNDVSTIEHAIRRGYSESLKAILEHGYDPNAIDPEDNNPLFLAVKYKQLDIAKLLLEFGADPDQQDGPEGKSAREFAEENDLQEFLNFFNNSLLRKEIIHSPDNTGAINHFINDLKNYCETRRAEWDLPKWMHVNEKSAQYKTNLISLKFGFSVEDKIKAAEKLIAALQNKMTRERLTDFDIAALLNSRLYSTVVKKHEHLFDQIEEVKTYKNKAQQLANTPQNPAA